MESDRTNDGVPQFIYGTAWKEDRTEELVDTALDTGFRGIDTANQRKHYHEEGVGAAIRKSIDNGSIDRDELFLQTKFTHAEGQDHRKPYDPSDPLRTQVQDSFERSLDHLNVDRIDSYLLHGPTTRSGLADADREVWRTMEELSRSNQLDAIGVSNIRPDQLETLLDFAEVKPTFVQNRCFARTAWDRPVREICAENDIQYQGFSLLTANQKELRNQTITSIAERHERTIPQVVFRFALQVGILPLTGTTDREHMKQDLACFEFELPEEDVRTIETIAVQ